MILLIGKRQIRKSGPRWKIFKVDLKEIGTNVMNSMEIIDSRYMSLVNLVNVKLIFRIS